MEYKDKKIVLIAPKFYSMQEEIKTALERQGAFVDYFEDFVYPYDYKYNACYGFRKQIYQIIENINKPKKKYWKNLLFKFKSYDILIWIDGYSFIPEVIDRLVCLNRDIIKVLYLYDDTTYYNFEDEFKYFDRVDTFDINDYENYKSKYSFGYLPLYWCKIEIPYQKKYDISCIGYCLPERLYAITKLQEAGILDNKRFFIKLLINTPSNFGRIKQLLKYPFFKKDRETIRIGLGLIESPFITKVPVPKNQTLQIINESKCVVDIVKKTQVGFTNRSMQSIGNGIKIISTNTSLKKTPFYDPDMIYILDLEHIDKNDIEKFTTRPLKEFQNDYLMGLEINEWIKKL